jgi:hypothetical protein
MPNQLSSTKERKSVTEHEAILTALESIAQREGTTTMSLMRQAIRETVRKRTDDSSTAKWLRSIVMRFAPKPPQTFVTAAQLARFKRSQREFDQVLLDLNLVSNEGMESMNSIVSPNCKLRVFELEKSNASS